MSDSTYIAKILRKSQTLLISCFLDPFVHVTVCVLPLSSQESDWNELSDWTSEILSLLLPEKHVTLSPVSTTLPAARGSKSHDSSFFKKITNVEVLSMLNDMHLCIENLELCVQCVLRTLN